MNSDLVDSKGKPEAQPNWQRQFEEWRELLARCGQKSSRRRVHALRVATLRLKAEVDFRLLDPGSTSKMGDAAKRWNKQANKLRKALSPVRDTDVHIETLEKLRSASGAVGHESKLTASCMREIEEVDKRLREERKSAESVLLKEIEDRRDRLARASRKLEEDLAKQTAWAESDRALLIRGIVAGLATEVTNLSATTLHEFRKRAKTARYLADVSAKRDSRVARQATLLKSMQNAAGKWHDLQTLADRADEAVSGGGEKELISLLRTLADQALQGALEVCRNTIVELLAQGALMGANGSVLPPKKPVRSMKAEDLPAGTSRLAVL